MMQGQNILDFAILPKPRLRPLPKRHRWSLGTGESACRRALPERNIMNFDNCVNMVQLLSNPTSFAVVSLAYPCLATAGLQNRVANKKIGFWEFWKFQKNNY